MSCLGFKIHRLKNATAYFAWFCVLLSTYLPAPVRGDLCTSADDELERRNKTAIVVAGLTVIGIAVGIVCLTTASGHHKHHERYSAMSSVDNYRPSYDSSSSCSYSYSYSDYSEDYSSDHHHHRHHHSDHHSGYYSSNPYSIFSENDVSSWSGDSESYGRDRLAARTKSPKGALCKSAGEESSLSGQFIVHSSSGQEGSLTVFVQLPDGTSRSLGSASLSGNSSLPYGPFYQKGVYTFGASLDQGNALPSQLNMGSIQIEVNGSTVQRHDFTAPPHAPASYEPAPCCFELS